MPYADPEKRKEANLKWRERNPEKYRASNRAYYHRTKEARADLKKAYYEANREKFKEATKRNHRKARYGFEGEVPSTCDVCGSDGTICIDHCHTTGVIRGFLCTSCNVTLGHMKDDPERLLALVEYLKGEIDGKVKAA